MATIVSIKSLRLVLPEAARQYGIAADAPVFLSPNIVGPHRCSACSVTYTPLVYQAGYTTRSHHWHDHEGGIYFYVADSAHVIATQAAQTGWLAYVEPVGKNVITGAHYGRAEAVSVRQITAWCLGHEPADCCIVDEAPVVHPVAEGALVAYPQLRGHPPLLLPVCCTPVEGDGAVVPFTFRVRDGTVVFTHRP
jgi:hypothetical protein